jgi:ribonuclease P protein component
MLVKQYRLPASQRLKNARFYKTPDFTVRVSENRLPHSRFGFIVRKNIDKRATVRNRARRVFRSCIEEMLIELKRGYDMLFSLEKGIIGKEREEVFTELKKFLGEKALLQIQK